MKKIRDFRLKLHFKELRRKARRQLDLDAMGLDDPAFVALLERAEAALSPAVIYESFGPESEETARLAPLPGLAHTLGLATLGAGADSWAAELASRSSEHGRLAELLLSGALDQTVQFVLGLLKPEVEAERCELSPIQLVAEPEALGAVHAKLEGGKIEVALEAGRLVPSRSAAFCLSWIKQRRGASKASKR